MPNQTFSVIQTNTVPILIITCLFMLAGIAGVLFFLIAKIEDYRELKKAFDRVMNSFNELDEQAKLIVKTNKNLNNAQEELDRRIVAMNALQRLVNHTSSNPNKSDILQRIDIPLIAELGFSKSFIATKNETGQFICRINIGMDSEKITHVNIAFLSNIELPTALENGETCSSLRSSQNICIEVRRLFECEHFILVPLQTQREVFGFVFFGNVSASPPIDQGDEELAAILSNQIAQSLENFRLFEQAYLSSRTLESKINERTKELSLALKSVEEISKKKSEFISAVSHELRTPLTSIKGYASILMTGKIGTIPDPVKQRLAKINSHSDNLVKLINDLLDISRIESGRVEMNTTPKNIKVILETVADMLLPQITTKGVSLRINIPGNVPEIEVDPTQIDRVFINLISNAIKFTPAGGTISINAEADLTQSEISFEVADTGIGIGRDDLVRLFDEFFRVDNEINLSVKGTGLGLALAKNIVEAHYGRIWVTSEINQGTTFHFTIPIQHKLREAKKERKTENTS